MNQMNPTNRTAHGREKLAWSQDVWNRIDKSVHDETKRIKIASRFLPIYGPMTDALTVPSDAVNMRNQKPVFPLSINEADTRPLIEIFVEFTLTPQQIQREPELMTAHTLSIRVANYLSQGEDLLIFQGDEGLKDPLFADGNVQHRSGPAGTGLLNAALRTIEVPPLPEDPDRPGLRWGENTFEAVAEG